jgi:hypothetical protein
MAKTIAQVAQEVRQSWDDAAGDISMNYEFDYGDEEMKKVYKENLKRTGSKQIARECIADHIHSDESSIMDFVGDRVHDAVTMVLPGTKWNDPKFSETFIAICEEAKKGGYGSWKNAMDKLIAQQKGYRKG